jgi:hypothetical protein
MTLTTGVAVPNSAGNVLIDNSKRWIPDQFCGYWAFTRHGYFKVLSNTATELFLDGKINCTPTSYRIFEEI